ncbi:MAG: hypothetical protein HYW05_02880 [Candidatus Diapherotrites archaeon]|nr:hypothetical protein [Candidatus Diapherotrites archaeon]
MDKFIIAAIIVGILIIGAIGAFVLLPIGSNNAGTTGYSSTSTPNYSAGSSGSSGTSAPTGSGMVGGC